MLRSLLERLRTGVADEGPTDHVEGSNEVAIDPVHNERYEGERELQRLSKLEESPQYSDPATHNQSTSGSYDRR